MFLVEDSLERRLIDALYYYPTDLADQRAVDALGKYLAAIREIGETTGFLPPDFTRGSSLEAASHIEVLAKRGIISEDVAGPFSARIRDMYGTNDGRQFSKWNYFAHGENWESWLGHLSGAPAVHVLEVGAFEGRSAVWWLENIVTGDAATLTCVDIFDAEETETRFDANLAPFAGDRLTKLKGDSALLVPSLGVESFDAVYIDANSTQEAVLRDCLNGWRALKRGGTIIIDDYGGPFGWEPEITSAVDAFLEAVVRDLEVVSLDGFQAALRKRPA